MMMDRKERLWESARFATYMLAILVFIPGSVCLVMFALGWLIATHHIVIAIVGILAALWLLGFIVNLVDS